MKNKPTTYLTHAGQQNAKKGAGGFLELMESVEAAEKGLKCLM